MFYLFRQNNSGGFYKITKELNKFVAIQANSTNEANDIAETKGIYFNGCEKDIDCECCGDRWYKVTDSHNWDQFETLDLLLDYFEKYQRIDLIIHFK